MWESIASSLSPRDFRTRILFPACVLHAPFISSVAGNSMDTGLATFMDGYTNFMETKSGEFCGGKAPRVLNGGEWAASRFALPHSPCLCDRWGVVVSTGIGIQRPVSSIHRLPLPLILPKTNIHNKQYNDIPKRRWSSAGTLRRAVW
jgi:hypothetical protein